MLIFRHSSTYGVDWDGPLPAVDDNTDAVVVPQTNSPLLPTKLAELRALYDPLSCSDNFGVISTSMFFKTIYNFLYVIKVRFGHFNTFKGSNR